MRVFLFEITITADASLMQGRSQETYSGKEQQSTFVSFFRYISHPKLYKVALTPIYDCFFTSKLNWEIPFFDVSKLKAIC